MEKRKAFFVTALIVVLTGGLWACLWKISGIGFAGITAFFSGIGFAGATVNVFFWLSKAPKEPVDKLELPDLHEDALEPPVVDELTYDAIRKEVEAL